MTSIQSVFAYLNLPDTEIDDKWAEEYMSQALDSIGIQQGYEEKVCLLTVSNHRVQLPSDLMFIQAVTYQFREPDEQEITKLTESLSKTTTVTEEEDGTQTITNTLTQLITTPGDTQNQSHILRIQHQGVLNNYQVWMDSDLYTSNYKLMKLTNRAFSANYHCDDCPNFECSSEHTYSITPTRTLQTSLETGNICISYLTRPKNEFGSIMIPDDVDFKMALAAYVKMRYCEEKMFMHENNMSRLYGQFKHEWEALSAKVRGKFIMKAVDEEGLRQAHKPTLNVIRNPRAFDNF